MKILVADDSPVLRAAVSKLLEPEGFEVVTAEDGVDAITRFYEEAPDLVLLDIQMPRLNGYVVCRLIKEDPAAADVPVMILTVRSSAEDRYWGAKSGADGYLTKDALGEELVSSIKAALASRALHELSSGEPLTSPGEHESDVLTRVCEMLDRKLFEATVVNEITAVAARPVGLQGTVDEILTSLSRLINFDASAIALPEEGRLEMLCHRRPSDQDVEEFRTTCADHLREMLGGGALPAELQTRITVQSEQGEITEPRGWLTFYAVPLRSRGQLIGMLALGAFLPGAFSDATHRTLRTVTPSIVSVLDSARQFQTTLADEAWATFSSLG